MAKDPRLDKLRSMDPTIGTFTARELVGAPDFVHQTYLGHAGTYMTLGNMSDYVDTLLRWARVNKGAVMGGLSGKYGYGKTSTAIHLWQQCEQARVIAVPPFEWHRLQDIVDATWAWVRYRVGQIQPGAVVQVDRIYARYREKSIQEFADEEGIAVSKVQELLERRKVSLRCHPEDVVEFLAEVSQVLEGEALQLHGPIVFTDELQVTMARYMEAHRSRDEFMEDLFELLNPLLNRQGSFGLMLGLPLPTEALIGDIRPDILQRLQHCNLFIRPSTMYDREFPRELWRRFAEVFEFADLARQILSADTLDSLGQIAFRDDLGAGPRTVIEAMQRAIDHYDQTGQGLSPLDLMDAYLAHQIAFDAGGKLIAAVAEVLQSREVQQIPHGDRAIKLMAAFPLGCPEERFQTYGLQDAKDEVARRVYAEYLYKFPEGVSLRKLAPTERGAEPRFIELTKDFIQTYSESERDLDMAIRAFREAVIQEQLLSARRKDQIEGWISDPQVAGQYVGTFDRKYPERRLAVRVSRDRAALVRAVEEFGLAFWFDPACDSESPGRIERAKSRDAGALSPEPAGSIRQTAQHPLRRGAGIPGEEGNAGVHAGPGAAPARQRAPHPRGRKADQDTALRAQPGGLLRAVVVRGGLAGGCRVRWPDQGRTGVAPGDLLPHVPGALSRLRDAHHDRALGGRAHGLSERAGIPPGLVLGRRPAREQTTGAA